MSLFCKKKKEMSRKDKKDKEDNKPAYAFADILRGLQNAVNGAQDMLQEYQLHNLSAFWNRDGTAVSQKVKLGDKDVDVPLLTLVPHSQLAMEDVVIRFKTRIGAVASNDTNELQGMLKSGNSLSSANLQVEMEGVGAGDTDVMDVTIRFKTKETPEAVARLMDEYNKPNPLIIYFNSPCLTLMPETFHV